MLPHAFILHKPKAVVSGDFYWINTVESQITIAVADCTGHGVPGAFMSILGYNMLENAIRNMIFPAPASILDALNKEMINSLSKGSEGKNNKHGMDISLISIDTRTHQLQFADAHNSIYIIRNKILTELKADKKGIGSPDKNYNSFTNQQFQLQQGDMIYLYTDGFPDQLNGSTRKKFFYQPFKDLLCSISELHVEEQQLKLDEIHANWKGEKMDQTDDILIMGIKY